MKIEIEIESSYKAKLTIDGREIGVEKKGCETRLVGVKQNELETTFGGIVASAMLSTVSELMSGWSEVVDFDCDLTAWHLLDDETIEAVNEYVY